MTLRCCICVFLDGPLDGSLTLQMKYNGKTVASFHLSVAIFHITLFVDDDEYFSNGFSLCSWCHQPVHLILMHEKLIWQVVAI